MDKKTESGKSGVGFGGLLAIVFITLKLLGKITWSWIWVLSPLWIPLAIFVAIFVVVFLYHIIKMIVKGLKK